MGICDPGEISKTNSKALKEYAKKTINSSGLSESKTNQIQGENFILKFQKKKWKWIFKMGFEERSLK